VLSEVWDALVAAMPFYGSVHRGAGFESSVTTQLFDVARQTILEFAGGDATRDIAILTENTTDAVNLLARRHVQLYGIGFAVVTSDWEHSSNLLPWQRWGSVRNCRVDGDGEWDLEHLRELLAATPTRIVAMTAASNVTGRVLRIRDVAAVVHEFGGKIIVDASQLAAHRAIERGVSGDAAHWDFVAFAGHKMYAPFGTGALVGPREFFEAGWPDRPGGGTVTMISGDDIVWADLPAKERGGSPNFAGTLALAEACATIRRIGFARIIEHEAALSAHAAECLWGIDGVAVLRSTHPTGGAYLPVFPFSVGGRAPGLVAAYLGHERAISVRAGHFCQYALMRELQGVSPEEHAAAVGAAREGDLRAVYGAVRASAGLTTTISDLDAIAEALASLVSDGPQAPYEQLRDGRFVIPGWSPPVPAELERLAMQHSSNGHVSS
jgi:selenocysteine lyase/cysteine desulfurase